jgi:hypothetical protein
MAKSRLPDQMSAGFSDATAQTTWQEYRRIFGGDQHNLAREKVMKACPGAWSRGAIRALYLPIVDYVCQMSAGAMNLPFRITGPEKFQALMKRWRQTLSRGWYVRRAPGSAFMHIQLHRDRLIVENLWGNTLKVDPDPQAPTEWDLLELISIPVLGDREYAYKQDENRNVSTWIKSRAASEYSPAAGAADGWGVVPVFPMYRDDHDVLQPPPDRMLLDVFISSLLQLSDIEYRRAYRTGILWRKRDGAGPNVVGGGGTVETGYDVVHELGDQDSMGLVESALAPADDLEYISGYLRLVAKTMGLPPELFVTGSRAETGAAKSWDYAPLLELQQTDRSQADEWLADFIEYIRPILEAEKIVGVGEQVSVRTVAPKQPKPSNLVAYAQGLENMCRMGAMSVVKDISERQGVSLKSAEKLAKINRAQNEALGIGTVDDRGAPATPAPSGDLNASVPE